MNRIFIDHIIKLLPRTSFLSKYCRLKGLRSPTGPVSSKGKHLEILIIIILYVLHESRERQTLSYGPFSNPRLSP